MNQKQAEEFTRQLKEIDREIMKIRKDPDSWLGKRFEEIMKRYEYKNEVSMGVEVMKYFSNVFNNLFSNSILLWKDMNSRGESITAGRYGFGIRENKQADPVKSLQDISILKKHEAEIIKALNDRRKWNKAEELEKFFNLIEGINFSKYSTVYIKLVKPIDVLYQYYDEMAFMKCNTLKISMYQNSLSLYLCMDDGSKHLDIIKPNAHEYGKYYYTLTNYLLDDQIDTIIGIFQDFIYTNSIEQKKLLQGLDNEFGRFLMCNNL